MYLGREGEEGEDVERGKGGEDGEDSGEEDRESGMARGFLAETSVYGFAAGGVLADDKVRGGGRVFVKVRWRWGDVGW